MTGIKGMTLEDALKPQIWTCGNCGGELHVYPYKSPLPTRGKNERFEIKAINICNKCTFGIDKPITPEKALTLLVEKFS